MRKIVNAPANAARGELLIYFDGDAVGDVEQTAAAAAVTRTAATRSGIAPVDDIFTQLGVASLRRDFPAIRSPKSAPARRDCINGIS